MMFMKVVGYRVFKKQVGPWYAPGKVWAIELVYENGARGCHTTHFYGHYKALKLAKYLAKRFGGVVEG